MFGSFYQVLRVSQLPVAQVHVPLGRRDICMPEQSPGKLDPLLAADFRPTLMPGEVQHQIAGRRDLDGISASATEVARIPWSRARGRHGGQDLDGIPRFARKRKCLWLAL
jgi:hypothetical protein